MRSRNIKPGFFKNEGLSEVTIETRMLFIGLWCIADREGRLEDRPKRIKIEVFPYDKVDIESMLDDLEEKSFILRYEAGGKEYIYINNFVKHQAPHYKEQESTIPPPPGMSDEIIATNITRKKRLEVFERDGFKCLKCGASSHLCIDHIVPVSRGGNSEVNNLQTLCMSCNTTKGNKLHGEEKNIKNGRENNNIQKFGPNSIQGRIDVGLKQALIDPLIPDSLIPDSLIPEELHMSDSGPPSCPHQEIISLYNDILGSVLTRVRPKLWNGKRQKHLQARWREDKERQNIAWWREYFQSVLDSNFLTGNGPPKDGIIPWKADMEWLVNQNNMTKVLEGKYKNKRDQEVW